MRWAIFGLAAALRVLPAVRRPLQVDEAYALHVATLPVDQILRVLRDLDVHPPLFWLVLHALELAHVPDLALRLLAALLGVACVALLFAIVRLWHGERAALIAAFCAAVMPSLIFYDITIRMYGLFDCLALAGFWWLSVLYAHDDLRVSWRRLAWVGWAACATALLYTQYLGFAVLAAQLIYAAAVRRDGFVRSAAGAAVAIGLWLPQLATFLHQLPAGGLAFPGYEHHELQALFELAGQVTIGVQTHGAASFAVPTAIVAWCWLIAAFALAAPGNARALTVWLFVPGLATLVYGLVAHKLLYVDRYYLLCAFGLCALTGIAVDRLRSRSKMSAPSAWIAGAALFAFGCLYAAVPAYYTADWPAVGALLEARARDRDLIIMEQGSSFFPLHRMGALGRRPLILVLRRGDVDAAIQLSRPFRRVWLVLFQSGPVDPQERTLRTLAARSRAATTWEFPRSLPAEGASLVLLTR